MSSVIGGGSAATAVSLPHSVLACDNGCAGLILFLSLGSVLLLCAFLWILSAFQVIEVRWCDFSSYFSLPKSKAGRGYHWDEERRAGGGPTEVLVSSHPRTPIMMDEHVEPEPSRRWMPATRATATASNRCHTPPAVLNNEPDNEPGGGSVRKRSFEKEMRQTPSRKISH